jgi:hypothetical protein
VSIDLKRNSESGKRNMNNEENTQTSFKRKDSEHTGQETYNTATTKEWGEIRRREKRNQKEKEKHTSG